MELYRRYVWPAAGTTGRSSRTGTPVRARRVESVALPPEPPARDPGAGATAPITQAGLRSAASGPNPARRPRGRQDLHACGEAKARIGEDEARVLNFIPAHFELQVHVLPKYACSHCRDGVVAPEGPPRPLSGCIAGAGVLAQVVVSKFAEHCRSIGSRTSRLVTVSICLGALFAIGSAMSLTCSSRCISSRRNWCRRRR